MDAPGLTNGRTQVATFAAHDDTVWITSRSGPAQLHVSSDDGASWHVVRIPA